MEILLEILNYLTTSKISPITPKILIKRLNNFFADTFLRFRSFIFIRVWYLFPPPLSKNTTRAKLRVKFGRFIPRIKLRFKFFDFQGFCRFFILSGTPTVFLLIRRGSGPGFIAGSNREKRLDDNFSPVFTSPPPAVEYFIRARQCMQISKAFAILFV